MSLPGKLNRFHAILLLMWLPFAANAFDILQPLPAQPPIPADNPQSQAKVELGKQLYFDPRLSANGDRACNACHNLMAGGDDDGVASHMGKPLKRSAPGLWNIGFQTVLFWDGRATSLESQLNEHLLDPQIMAIPDKDALVRRLDAIDGYREAFAKAFPGKHSLSFENITRAVASFERTLLTPNSAFDRYIRGDKNAISASAKRGLKLFDDIGCLSCHFGVNFAGPAPGPAIGMGEGFYELFPNHLGTAYDKKYDLASDLGVYDVTKNDGHKHMWRVPMLRNIALTAPYFHNGSVDSLDEAVRIMAKTQLKTDLTDMQTRDIVEFLDTLTGDFPAQALPRLPDMPNKTMVSQYAK